MAETIEFFLKMNDNIRSQLAGNQAALDNFGKGVNALRGGFDNVAAAAGGISSRLMGLTGLAGGIGLGAIAKQVVDLGSSFEDTALSIAGNIKAFDLAATFDEARKMGSGALDIINQKAAALPGETEEYIQVFKTALPKAIESGLRDITKIADFTSQYAAVAISNQVDATQAGMDLMRLLGGQAGLDVRTWTMLSPHIGMAATEFNKLTAEMRRMKIESALAKFTEQLTAAGDTYSAKIGELQSRVKALLRLGAENMFEAAKGTLTEINAYLEKNKDALIATGKVIAEDVIKGFRTLLEYAPTVAHYLKTIAEIWLAVKAGIIATAIVDGIYKIVLAMRALQTVSTMAAVKTAFATGGVSLLAGAAAAAAAYAALRKIESDVGDTFAAMPSGFEAMNATKLATEEAAGAQLDLAEAIARSTSGMKTLYELSAVASSQNEETFSVLRAVAGYLPQMTAAAQADFARMVEMQGFTMEQVTSMVGVKTPTARQAAPNFDFRNSRFDISQQFAEGFDPDRVAVAFASDLARLGEMRVQSALVPAVGLAGG